MSSVDPPSAVHTSHVDDTPICDTGIFTSPDIVILAPILEPLAENSNMNEIMFCIMMITVLGVGFITPPLGLHLFVVSGITGESILKIAVRAVPHVLCMLIVVLLIAFVPAVSPTLLPDIYK